MKTLSIGLCSALAYFTLTSVAWAGTISAQGNVTALDDITQIPSITGQALFDAEGSGYIPLDMYPGITLQTGELSMMLAGVMEAGDVSEPLYTVPGIYFPLPITGGGVQQSYLIVSGAAIFADPITQFGLTAGGSVTSYITVWDANGVMLGQVTWDPEDEGDAAFVGIDTMGVPIGLLTVGSDDVWGGVPLDNLGVAARTDTWIWGLGDPCQTEADCLDDTWSCTAHACNAGACEYPATVEACDDFDACTEMDTCSEFTCAGTMIDCNDSSVCTFDSCDSRTGCVNDPIDGCCLSDEDCPEGEMCLIGSNSCYGAPPDDTTTTTTTDSGTETDDEVGVETDETGAPIDDADRGCGCSAREGQSGAVLGVLGLIVLGASTRRRR